MSLRPLWVLIAVLLCGCKPDIAKPKGGPVSIAAPEPDPAATYAADRRRPEPDPDDGKPAPDVPPLAVGVVLKAVAEHAGHAEGLVIRGDTNLPDGTRIEVDVKAPDGYGFYESLKAVDVERGRFHTAEVVVPDGEFVSELTVFVGPQQPDSVQAAFGDNGRNLRGRLVKRSPDGATVETTVGPFVVGEDKAKVQREDRAARKDLRDSLVGLAKSLRETATASKTGSKDPSGPCMAQLRITLDAANKASKTLDKLSLNVPGVGDLREAVSFARMCAGCAEDARVHCDNVLVVLKDADKALRQPSR